MSNMNMPGKCYMKPSRILLGTTVKNSLESCIVFNDIQSFCIKYDNFDNKYNFDKVH